MGADITYYWAKDHLRIDLGNRSDARIRMFLWIELIFTTGLATIFMIQAFHAGRGWIGTLTVTGSGLLYVLAAFRFISRITLREQIVLTPTHFSLIRKSLITRSVRRYQWKYMGQLHYLGKDQKTDFPYAAQQDPDHFGIVAGEYFIQNLHRDGSLYFSYLHQPVRFGRFIFSWHAEEIVRMMKLYMGDSLQLGAEWKKLMQEQEEREGWE